MNIYLSRIYALNGRIGAIEIVRDYGFDNMIFETIYPSKIGSRLAELSQDPRDFDFDFSKDDNLVWNYSATVEIVKLQSVDELPVEGEVKPKTMTSLWDLLSELSNRQAGYLPSDYENCNYIPSFNQIKVSNSTMTICIPIYDEDRGWLSKNIVDVHDGCLRQTPFYVLLDQGDYRSLVLDYNLRDCGEITIDDKVWKKLYYDCSLPLCDSCDRYVYCEPVIANYVYQQNSLKKFIDSVKAYIKTLVIVDEDVPQVRKTNVFRRANPSGCFFSLKNCEKFTRGYGDKVLNVSRDYYNKLKEIGEAYDRSLMFTRLSKANLSNDFLVCVDLVIGLLMQQDSKNTLDSYDYANLLLDNLNQISVKTNLFLYNVRVAVMFNQAISYKFKIMKQFEIKPGKRDFLVSEKIK